MFNVSADKNEKAKIILSNNKNKITVVFSDLVMLNENINNKYIFFKLNEFVHADIKKTILKKNKIY